MACEQLIEASPDIENPSYKTTVAYDKSRSYSLYNRPTLYFSKRKCCLVYRLYYKIIFTGMKINFLNDDFYERRLLIASCSY